MEVSEKTCELPDIQNSISEYKLPIETVGIGNFKAPIYIKTKSGTFQNTVAVVNAFIDLKAESKGINMSRLPITLQKHLATTLNPDKIKEIAINVRKFAKADRCQLIYKFPYFIQKLAPESKEPGLCSYDVTFDICEGYGTSRFNMTVNVIATSLCPCSKEISYKSAHNQRSNIILTVSPKEDCFVWLEDMIEVAEMSSSCEIYSVLKREDEKYVTEKAYENPKFVEDIVRSIYCNLVKREDLNWFRVEVSNEESIHQHNAVAIMDSREDWRYKV
jgi:GTP cyclohydrolase I